MDLIIHDKLTEKDTFYENVTVVPSVGSKVAHFYQPFPTVTEVIFDYEKGVVCAICE